MILIDNITRCTECKAEYAHGHNDNIWNIFMNGECPKCAAIQWFTKSAQGHYDHMHVEL